MVADRAPFRSNHTPTSSNYNATSEMSDSNPANFANLPKERVKEIAAMGGHASHGKEETNDTSNDAHAKKLASEGRNPNGSFKPGSKAASEAGHIGGLHAHGKEAEEEKNENEGDRRANGTFTKGSEAAKEGRL